MFIEDFWQQNKPFFILPFFFQSPVSQGILWNSWWDTSWSSLGREEWRSRAVRMSPTLVSYTVDANAAIYFTFSVLCEKLSILIYIQFWIFTTFQASIFCVLIPSNLSHLQSSYLFFFFVSGSLSALVYQHSITPISLPCPLHIPEKGINCLIRFKTKSIMGEQLNTPLWIGGILQP